MSRDTLRFYKFTCSCEQIHNISKWESELSAPETCPCEKKEKMYMVVDRVHGEAPVQVGKYKNGRPAKEKRSRSLNHFKREIYPNLHPSDQKMFDRKHKK